MLQPARSVVALTLASLLLACLLSTARADDARPKVEMSHWWVSDGEQHSLNAIRRHVEASGLDWQQRVTRGSGTSRYWDVLREQLAAGEPPTASQVIGFDIRQWATSGQLASLDAVAKDGEWDEVIPHAIQQLSRYQGHWVAVPINAHSTNWLWVNRPLFAHLGMPEPDTWDDLLPLLEKARNAGIIPLAMGKEPWEQTLLFENVAAGVGGAEFYRRAFIRLDASALDNDLPEQIFARISALRPYLDPDFMQQHWEDATDKLRNNQALFQVQGSWVLGEFRFHGLSEHTDYLCLRFPDTQGMYLFNADQYMLFAGSSASEQTRRTLAEALISPQMQAELSMATGAAPARVDIARDNFDDCGRRSISDLRNANMRRTLLGSIGMGNANPAPVKQAIYQLVHEHLLGQLDDTQAASRLRQIIAAGNSESIQP